MLWLFLIMLLIAGYRPDLKFFMDYFSLLNIRRVVRVEFPHQDYFQVELKARTAVFTIIFVL